MVYKLLYKISVGRINEPEEWAGASVTVGGSYRNFVTGLPWVAGHADTIMSIEYLYLKFPHINNIFSADL